MYGISLVKLCNCVRVFFFCKEIVVKVRGICSFFSEVVYGFHKFKLIWYGILGQSLGVAVLGIHSVKI